MAEASTVKFKQQVIENANNAVAGKPPQNCNAACSPCHRTSLELMTAAPSVVAAESAQALKSRGYSWAPEFDAEFSHIQREATVPVARITPAGFIYLYFTDRKRWDVWRSLSNGLKVKLMHQVNAEQYAKMAEGLADAPEPASCSRGAANLPAQLIDIRGAADIHSVWITYAPHLWAPMVVKNFEANAPVDVPGPDGKPAKKPLRQTLSKEISPAAMLKGQLPAGALPLTADVLARHVVDFGPPGNGGQTPAPVAQALKYSPHPPQPQRFGQAADMDKAVRTAEALAGPRYLNKSVVLMLDDPIGVAEAHNNLRLGAAARKVLWSTGGPDEHGQVTDKERGWKLASMTHVDTVMAWARAQAEADARQQVTHDLSRQYPPVTEEDFNAKMQANGYPPGTTWEPLYLRDASLSSVFTGQSKPKLDANGEPVPQMVASQRKPGTQTRLGRVIASSTQVKAVVDKYADEGRVPRYQEKLEQAALEAFRQQFKGGCDKWDAVIDRFDRDFIAWRDGARLQAVLLHEFDHAINLKTCKPVHGTPEQQVADVMARLEALGRCFSGGAIAQASTQAMAKLLGKKPDDPTSWIDNALVGPFNLTEALKEPDRTKETAEDARGLVELKDTVVELHETVKEILERRHEEAEEHMHALLEVRAQAVGQAAASIDGDAAKALGIAQHGQQAIEQEYKLHVRLTALLDQAINRRNPLVTLKVQVPVGVALDTVAEAIMENKLPATMEENITSRSQRKVRQRTATKLRLLRGRPGLTVEMNYPVMLRRDDLVKIQQNAAKKGVKMVKVVPDATASTLANTIELPESIALDLIKAQTVTVRQRIKAGASMGGIGSVGIGVLQVYAMWEAVKLLPETHGYERADALASILTAACGLGESVYTVRATMYAVQFEAGGIALEESKLALAKLRLTASVAGAGASLFSGISCWIKYKTRGERGDAAAADQYLASARMYWTSSALLAVGAYVNRTVAQATARQIGLGLIRYVGVEAVGVEAAGIIGLSLSGIGTILMIAGFAWSLYALYLEDDLNEIFLKRSYWGTKKEKEQRQEGRFETLEAENGAFAGLSVGIRATLDWSHDHGLRFNVTDVVEATLTIAHWSEEYQLEVSLALASMMHAGPMRCTVVATEPEREGSGEAEGGAKKFKIKHTGLIDSKYRAAKFAYTLYQAMETGGKRMVAMDTLWVEGEGTWKTEGANKTSGGE